MQQYILTAISPSRKSVFQVGQQSPSPQLLQGQKKGYQNQYPGYKIVLRRLEAFKQTPIAKKDY